MKQAIRYIEIYCAVLLSIVLIRHQIFCVMIIVLLPFTAIIIIGIEAIAFSEFIMAKYPDVYYARRKPSALRSPARCTTRFWDYAVQHLQSGTTSDKELLENCRRYIYCSTANFISFMVCEFAAIMYF